MTTEKQKHKPPYTLEYIGDNCAELQPMNYLLRFGGGNSTREEYDQADVENAEFIVRACNSHYDLLEACKAALDGLYSYRALDGNCSAMSEKAKLEAAIQKAEGL